MKKLAKKVDELLDSLKKDQSAFTMCCNDDGEFFYAYNARNEEIGAGIAAILSDWFENEKASSQVAAEGIVAGLHAVIKRGGKASDAVLHILAKVAAETTLKRMKNLLEDLHKDLEDGEDCENCDDNRTCNLSAAIKYRKANGIPAPKKHSNKRCKENEKGS